MPEFSHLNEKGEAKMVDVSEKKPTFRVARAGGKVVMKPATLQQIQKGDMEKGDVLGIARIAGIMAAKKTDQIIPLCHSLNLENVDVNFFFCEQDNALEIEAIVETFAKTGVEMEALTAVCAAALTIYDMCKSVDRCIEFEGVRLLEKKGGRSGHFRRADS